MPKRIISDKVIKIWNDEEVMELMNAAKKESDEAIEHFRGELKDRSRELQDLRTQTHDAINGVRTELEKRAEERIKEIEEKAEKEIKEYGDIANECTETGKKASEEITEKNQEIDTLMRSNAALKGVVTKLKNQIKEEKNE